MVTKRLTTFALAGLSTLAKAMTSVNAADPEYEFTFAHVLIESTPNAQAAEKFKEEVEKNSDGKIKINIRPAAQLGGDVEIIEQTQMNLVQIAIPPTGNLANFDPKMYLFDLPFLITDNDSMKRGLEGDVGEGLREGLGEYGRQGMKCWGGGFG